MSAQAVRGEVAPPGSKRSLGVLIGAAALVVFPWLPFVSFSILGSANLAAYYAMVAISLVVLVGWVGQISLGHAGLVGVGAYVTGHVVNGWHVTFPVNLLWAALAGGLVAGVLGAVALRVRGLYLAVATLIFAWTASEFLFRQKWFIRNSTIDPRPFGEEGTFPYFDWTSRRTYYYVAWAAVVTVMFLMANVRDSKTGRAFFAVRGSEVAAASLGISVTRTKLVAFAISGALAGMAGNLLMLRDQAVTADAFTVETSLFFLAIAVVGGLTSLGGAVASALLFASLNELFFRLEFLSGWLEVVPPALLTLVLLLYRGGLAAIPGAVDRRLGPRARRLVDGLGARWKSLDAEVRRRLAERRGRHAGDAVEAPPRPPRARAALRTTVERLPAPVGRLFAPLLTARPGAIRPPSRLDLAMVLTGQPVAADKVASNGHGTVADPSALVDGDPEAGPRTWRSLRLPEPTLPVERDQRAVLVAARGVTVRFGGLVAVNDVSLTVRDGEIVGLIGPNGAGKTTTFNSIAGLNVPTAGTVRIFDYDVTTWTVDERARLGVGRTFQAIQLLPQLSVFDNLLVATHLENSSGLFSHLFVTGATLDAELAARRRVRHVAEMLEIEEYLDRVVADLPFGVLRMVELARALVTGSRLVMLDEPASGLDNAETDRLAEILRFVRRLGVTLLLIEHDVKMVTSVSDYMYVLDHGTLLAEGTPAEIQRDARVIAAYLGQAPDAVTEDEALAVTS